MPQNIDIKPVDVLQQYDIVFKLMEGLHGSEQEMFDMAASWTEIGKNYMQHVIEMQTDYDGSLLIAYVDDTPAGFIFGYLEEQDNERIEAYTGKYLYVSDGYIVPAYRRMGIYKMLNEAIETLYIAKGIRRIMRLTLYTNTRMRQFLEKESYQPVRVLYEKWLSPDGNTPLPLTVIKPVE